HDWTAERLTREELCAALAGGPRLAVYVGHGRPQGWSGYQAVRWDEVAAPPLERPCGTVVGFTCSTLRRERGAVPFGGRWVGEGRAAAYLGAVRPVRVEPGFRLTEALGEELARGAHATIGALLAALDRRLRAEPGMEAARRELRAFRLMGNPLQPLY
ncbi:MAG TPA: C25 family cysteine peptidase, partial [Longimicrobiaceae bacterium]|nr:C25 family cysteine peptidase [Longimicrobiaceae bacterium]